MRSIGRITTISMQPGEGRWAFEQVHRVHLIRNRIAHHESLINGIPIPGSKDAANRTRRIPPQEYFPAFLRLVGMIDRNLKDFIMRNSTVPNFLGDSAISPDPIGTSRGLGSQTSSNAAGEPHSPYQSDHHGASPK